MIEIIPAIIAKNFKELQEKIKLVESYVKWAQIDVMDGKFTPPRTWPYNSGSSTSRDLKTKLNLEVHLMIKNPEKTIDEWLAPPVKRILIHYESAPMIQIIEVLKKIKKAGKEAGIVLNMETPVSVLNKLFQVLGFMLNIVQLMSIAEIGYYGHEFDDRVLKKIKALRKKYPKVVIEVDGGINLETAKKVAKAGTNRLVAGSYIFKSKNIKGAIESLRNI